MLSVFLVVIVLIYISIRFTPRAFFRILSFLSSPFVRLYIRKRILSNLEDKNRYTERFGIPSKKRPDGDIVWIHAVSVGEVISCIPFINILKKINSSVNILLTTTTRTSSEVVLKRLQDKVIHQYVPFDVFTWVRRFVKYWKPKAVFFVESELWPNTLYYLYEKDIPIYLLNARISAKSLSRMYLLAKYLGIFPYRLFREVFTPSEEIKRYVRDLGAFTVTVAPNMKFIAEKLPFKSKDSDKIKDMFKNRKTWISVSTHEGEEEIILSVHKKLKDSEKDILSIIAVRHPQRVLKLQELCKSEGLSFSLHSSCFEKSEDINTDIYIIDSIGCLGMFFDSVKSVFVGGSLVEGIGGHNIVEPLNFNCNVVTGSYIENFRDMRPYLENHWVIVNNTEELFKVINSFLDNENYSKIKKNDISKYKNIWEKLTKRISMEFFN